MTALQRKRERDKAMAPHYGQSRRLALILTISPEGVCALCGKKPKSATALQIDHVDGRDWVPRQHNQWTRAARYWREFLAGVRMRVLCKKCNGSYRPPTYRDQAQVDFWKAQTEVVPF